MSGKDALEVVWLGNEPRAQRLCIELLEHMLGSGLTTDLSVARADVELDDGTEVVAEMRSFLHGGDAIFYWRYPAEGPFVIDDCLGIIEGAA